MLAQMTIRNHFTHALQGMPIDTDDKRIISMLTDFLAMADYGPDEMININYILEHGGLYELGFYDNCHNQVTLTLRAR